MHIICKDDCLPLANIFPSSLQAGLVVAEVFSVNAHPKSDRLRVCSVDYGHDVAQVVTDAAEVAAGMKVIFAVCVSTCICHVAKLHCIISLLSASDAVPPLIKAHLNLPSHKRHACMLYSSKACYTPAKHVLLVHVKRTSVSKLLPTQISQKLQQHWQLHHALTAALWSHCRALASQCLAQASRSARLLCEVWIALACCVLHMTLAGLTRQMVYWLSCLMRPSLEMLALLTLQR